jgi:signal transduction histidine kinase
MLMARLLAAAVAAVLLVVHRVTPYDGVLIVAVTGYTAVSLGLLTARPRLQLEPVAWLLDSVAVLGLVAASQDWRSPFYVLMLTALILPSTGLRFRRALAWVVAFTLGYLGVAVYTNLDPNTLQNTIRLETIATHVMVPLVVGLALAYSADVLDRLRTERRKSERLAVQSERQRIAWELHDSAKQRVHAAHLVLSALHGQVEGAPAELVEHALAELRAAGAEMDTSVAELRQPLEGRPLELLLSQRAAELAAMTDAEIAVNGAIGDLPAHVAAHTYRIAAEALTNAVRHAGAARIEVTLARDATTATVEVADDGCGLPATRRPASNGLRSMRARSETIGATLRIASGPERRGTSVKLTLPTTCAEGS